MDDRDCQRRGGQDATRDGPSRAGGADRYVPVLEVGPQLGQPILLVLVRGAPVNVGADHGRDELTPDAVARQRFDYRMPPDTALVRVLGVGHIHVAVRSWSAQLVVRGFEQTGGSKRGASEQ